MAGKAEPLPDHLRCNRTDGRQWRCNRRVVDGKKLCEVHFIQGQHRSKKQKVPEELKIQREWKNPIGKNGVRVGKKKGGVELGNRKRGGVVEAEAVDKAVTGIGLKEGDRELELIRMVLKREAEKRRKRKELEETGMHSAEEGGELVTQNLPNGLMAISQASLPSNAGCSNDVKVGVEVGAGSSRRVFRSKNIEPVPDGAMQVVPFAHNVKKGRKKRCHWCRKSGRQNLVQCLSCSKEFFCLECIKLRYFDTQEEVKMACPVCRKICRCNVCLDQKSEDIECKDQQRGDRDVGKIVYLHYLICILLPILKQVNEEQNSELEMEAKFKGVKPTELDIELSKTELNEQHFCSKCKLAIVDLHRSCPNCSLRLCFSCCWNICEARFPESLKELVSKFLDRNKPESEQVLEQQLTNTLKQGVIGPDPTSVPSVKWKTCKVDIGMLCPAIECGGCGNGLLNLRCNFPSGWTRKLQDSAEEIVCSYAIPETPDISSGCSYCVPVDCEDNRAKQQEAAMRDDLIDNFLYYPTVTDIHNDKIDHFQKHWARGQPVIVRDVLMSTSELTWDPVVLFSTYLECSISKFKNGDGQCNSTTCPDWVEVDISTREVHMGSLKGQRQPKMSHMLKLKAWLSSNLFKELFAAHYVEVVQSLPLQQYMNPKSGFLNLAAKVPQNIKIPDLGPCVYISCGSCQDMVQGEFVTKLSYGPYDVVNILAHATDAPISDERLSKIKKLIRKRSCAQNHSKSFIAEDNNEVEARGKPEHLKDNLQGAGLQNITRDANLNKRVFGAFGFLAGNYEAGALPSEDENITHDGIHYPGSDNEISGVPCGALWDVFRRQDVPKLLEYLRRHCNEFTHSYSFREHVIHPIFDRSLFLDCSHKARLKEECQIEPWTFMQRVGEAVIIPAGCPYQIQSLKSCVNVVLDFVSPESVKESIQLNKEICMLPENHKAKVDKLEIKNIALDSISEAVREISKFTIGNYKIETATRLTDASNNSIQSRPIVELIGEFSKSGA